MKQWTLTKLWLPFSSTRRCRTLKTSDSKLTSGYMLLSMRFPLSFKLSRNFDYSSGPGIWSLEPEMIGVSSRSHVVYSYSFTSPTSVILTGDFPRVFLASDHAAWRDIVLICHLSDATRPGGYLTPSHANVPSLKKHMGRKLDYQNVRIASAALGEVQPLLEKDM